MVNDKRIIDTLKEFYPELNAIYIFGSTGTEYETQNSDIDIAVLLPYNANHSKDAVHQFDCSNMLAKRLSKDIDLILLRSAPAVLQMEIIENGRIIYNNDEMNVSLYEILCMNLYQKYCEALEPILADGIAEGRFNYEV